MALFSQKLLVCLEIIFFRLKKCKNSSKKKHWVEPLPAGLNGILDHQAQLDPRWNG
jgi:hypothetical protein